MRILAVDHGEKRIGTALSDSTGTLARPLLSIAHVSRGADASRVAQLAAENQVALIVIGESTDENGLPNEAGRRARRFADELKHQVVVPVEMWDETLSTQDARQARIAAGASRKRRSAPIDSLAASIILQSYLDAHPNREDSGASSHDR